MDISFHMNTVGKVLEEIKEKPVYIEISILGFTLFLFAITLKPVFIFTLGVLELYIVAYDENVDVDFLSNNIEIEYDEDDWSHINEEDCEICEDKDDCGFYEEYLDNKKEGS